MSAVRAKCTAKSQHPIANMPPSRAKLKTAPAESITRDMRMRSGCVRLTTRTRSSQHPRKIRPVLASYAMHHTPSSQMKVLVLTKVPLGPSTSCTKWPSLHPASRAFLGGRSIAITCEPTSSGNKHPASVLNEAAKYNKHRRSDESYQCLNTTLAMGQAATRVLNTP